MSVPDLIDSHCHIIFPNFQNDLDDVAKRWREVGIKTIIHACVEPSEIPAIRSLADRFPEMRYSVGVHPLDIQHWDNTTFNLLRSAASNDHRVVAIGELGLDLFKDSNLEEQLYVLKKQFELALELDLPVIIHCRDASEPMLDLLQKLNSIGQCPKGVMHCWGGNTDEMQGFLDLGFYISFSGIVTFPKAFDTHDCARKVPENRFLIETDCPFLAPVPWRGKRNEPSYVQVVAQKIAEIRQESYELVAIRSTDNAKRLFNLT